MAKVRRIVRKVEPLGQREFDEQQWPVNLALFVLGGFLMGATIAYLFNSPWYIFWPVLCAVPVAIGLLMVALRYISSRFIRRTMQLAFVIGVVVHLLLAILMFEVAVFVKYGTIVPPVAQLIKPRKIVTIPDYTALSPDPNKRLKQDFDLPIETKEPERQPEEIDRQDTRPEEAPTEPQPIPTPESERTVDPAVIERQTPQETTPREADTQSKLSRQDRAVKPRVSTPVEPANPAPKVSQNSDQPSAKLTEPTKQQTANAQAPTAALTPDLNTPTPQQQARMVRQPTQETLRPETTAQPTLERATPTPTPVTPQTQVAAVQPPSQSRQNQPDAPQPSTLSPSRQQTASPERQPTAVEPVPDPRVDPSAALARRETPTEVQPNVAQTPVEVPNQRTRITARPTVAPPTQVATPTQAPAPAPQQPSDAIARTSPTQRSSTEPQVQRETPAPQVNTSVSQPTPAAMRRTTADTPTPTTQAQATPTPRRSPSTPQAMAQANPVETPASTNLAQNPASTQLAPAPTSTSRQSPSSTSIARAETEPTPAPPSTATAAAPQKRSTPTENAPAPTTNPSPAPTPQRSTAPPTAAPTAATVALPSTAPTTAPATGSQVAAQTSPVQQTTASRQIQTERAVAEPSPSAQPTPTNTPSVARRQSDQSPSVAAAEAAPTPSTQRSTATPSTNPTTVAQAAPVASQAAPTAAAPSVRPNTLTTSKQTSESPLAAPTSDTAPAPQTAPSTAQTASMAPRRPASEATPSLTETPSPATSQVARATGSPNVSPSPSTAEVAVSAAPTAAPAAQPGIEATARTSETQRNSTASQIQAVSPTASAPSLAAANPTASPTSIARRESPANAPAVTTAAADAATPQRSQTNAAAASTSVAAAAPAAVADAPTAAAPTPSAVATSTSKQAPGENHAAMANADPTALGPAASNPTATAAVAPRRQPNAESAPTTAQAAVSQPTRRESTTTTPSATTSADQVATSTAAVSSDNPQPRPASSDVARQPTTSPGATISQPSLADPSASPTTQVAQAVPQRANAADTPTLNPQAAPTNSPARTAQLAPAPVSPTAIESPAVALADRAAGHASAQPAQMALTRSTNGAAGVGESANMDRSMPAANNPSFVASAAAIRPKTTQTEEGPSLSPSELAQVSRSQADAQRPNSPYQATPVEIPNVAGSREPSEQTASASAALNQQASNADKGPVSAAAGVVEIDLGPTRIMAEFETGRAGGGGQPTLNPDTHAHEIARAATGGAPQMAMTADTVAVQAAAPTADGGGQPQVPQAQTEATALARTDSGGGEPATGGPATSTETGPPSELSTASQIAQAALQKAEAADAAPGEATAGGALDDEEEERRRRQAERLARSRASGANQLALGAPTTADLPRSPSTTAAGGATGGPQIAAALTTTRQPADAAAGGAPAAGGGPSAAAASGPPTEPGGGQTIAAAAPQRAAAAAGGQPPAGEAADSPQQIARAASGGSPPGLAGALAVAALPQSPAVSASGGAPSTSALAVNDQSAAPTKVDVGGAPAGGGPSAAAQAGPRAPQGGGEQVAQAVMPRVEAGGGQPETGQAAAAEQLARASGGQPQLALGGPSLADTAAAPSPLTPGAPGAPGAESSPTALAAAKASVSGGSPAAGGGPSAAASAGPPVEPGGGAVIAAVKTGRSETAEAMPGAPTEGGGTGTPTRTATGPLFAAAVQAELPTLSGMPSSSGAPTGPAIAAQGVTTTRAASGGVTGPASQEPAGAMAGPAAILAQTDPTASAGVQAGNRRSTDGSGAEGPTLAVGDAPGSPGRTSNTASVPQGLLTLAMVPTPEMGGPSAAPAPGAGNSAGDMSDMADDMDIGPMSRDSEGGLAVQIAAAEGPGGVGSRIAVDVGLPGRRSQADSMEVTFTSPTRFPRQEAGGKLNFNTSAVVRADAFRGRRSPDRGETGGGSVGGPPPETEESIELGLLFLARHQSPDGSWSFQNFAAGRGEAYKDESAVMLSDTAATALAMLAFQGAGYTHREHKHQVHVSQAIAWMKKNQKEDGDLFVVQTDDAANNAARLYSHAIAAQALCEAYGLTQDPELKEAAQKSIDFIVKAQDKRIGGWRYTPGQGADTSVTGWMMMALYVGKISGLEVPDEAFDRIHNWLDLASASEQQPYRFRYNPLAPDTEEQRHGRSPTKVMTAVGLLMRLYSGWRRDNPNMIAGAEYLSKRLPSMGTERDPQRDTYYWYYATQVMFHMGGKYWDDWYGQLHPLLVSTQVQRGPFAGSWNPRTPVKDLWGPHGGRVYVTTMNLLSLEIYFRHSPLYEDIAK
ncbi:hypothetical protein [Lignipirellula cremea]|uniref:Uncharacterized protein n=1 Tax=Lignipirellula cremea TaxID=2528010 RepID=A0A518E4R1_9BACT|nr:hypothetical protein [Lignipirellula cremea]QDU99090.1 hypothetical protein Pla8534_70010 [Lignipirellula cremea]